MSNVTDAVESLEKLLKSSQEAYWKASDESTQDQLAQYRLTFFQAYTMLLQKNFDAKTPEFQAASKAAQTSIENLKQTADHIEKMVADADKVSALMQDAARAFQFLIVL